MTEPPRCAEYLCMEPLVYVLTINGGTTIAFACAQLGHLKDVMYATRHLGDRRTIGHLATNAPLQPTTDGDVIEKVGKP